MPSYSEAKRTAERTLQQICGEAPMHELHKSGITKIRSLLGGSHSVVTYPPLDSLVPTSDPNVIMASFSNPTAHIYIHIPFCESRCTFCHYVVALSKGIRDTTEKQSSVAHYLTALKLEITATASQCAKQNISIASVYIGGGTPFILSEEQIIDLITTLKNSFSFIQAAEWCFEASPLTITAPEGKQKLACLQKLGITRLSFGIQSFDDEVLRIAGRGYTSKTAIEACQLAAHYFENWNVDLIQGLYYGSTKEVWQNIQILLTLRPPHITWYHGRFSSDRPQGMWRDKKQEAFETEHDTLVGRLLLWQELQKHGYTQIDGNRFVRATSFIDPFKKIRTSIHHDLIGLGVSAYGHTASWFYRNTISIAGYIKMVHEKQSAIATARYFSEEEKIAASYVVGLRTERYETERCTSNQMQTPVVKYYKKKIAHFKKLGLLEACGLDGTGLKLTLRGRLFEDEILASYYSPTVREYLRKKK